MPIRNADDEIVAVAQVINKTNDRGFTRDDEKVSLNPSNPDSLFTE